MATTTTPLNFRLATPDDAVLLERLINDAFRADDTSQVFLSTEHKAINVTDVATILAKIAEPDCAVLVATDPNDHDGGGDGSTLVAHCSVRKLDGNRAWFGMLAVSLHCQHRSFGSQLLKYAEDYARREWNATRMEFDVVNTRAELIAYYGRRGFQPTGATTPFPYYYHGDWKGVLRHDLHFIIMGKDL